MEKKATMRVSLGAACNGIPPPLWTVNESMMVTAPGSAGKGYNTIAMLCKTSDILLLISGTLHDTPQHFPHTTSTHTPEHWDADPSKMHCHKKEFEEGVGS